MKQMTTFTGSAILIYHTKIFMFLQIDEVNYVYIVWYTLYIQLAAWTLY